jgi:hypothetical protein
LTVASRTAPLGAVAGSFSGRGKPAAYLLTRVAKSKSGQPEPWLVVAPATGA